MRLIYVTFSRCYPRMTVKSQDHLKPWDHLKLWDHLKPWDDLKPWDHLNMNFIDHGFQS